MKKQLRHHEPLVVQPDRLFAVGRTSGFFRAFEETASQRSEIGQDVISSRFEQRLAFCRRVFLDPNFCVFGWNLQILIEVEGDEAGVLFAGVHDVGLFEDVDLSIGDDFLQVIRKELSANVDTRHSWK